MAPKTSHIGIFGDTRRSGCLDYYAPEINDDFAIGPHTDVHSFVMVALLYLLGGSVFKEVARRLRARRDVVLTCLSEALQKRKDWAVRNLSDRISGRLSTFPDNELNVIQNAISRNLENRIKSRISDVSDALINLQKWVYPQKNWEEREWVSTSAWQQPW